ncbi:uncharacterized protein LOC107009182 [Solanum pennellii]|uniref:Uncharacterized protein LOC107009182 n=1 Tax=Solanum pennellii TaxID=28526 RepID=A0ABM1V2L9_SOLPN|nr:uncharacterized protein LOC107009182 [Solanum pennellii]
MGFLTQQQFSVADYDLNTSCRSRVNYCYLGFSNFHCRYCIFLSLFFQFSFFTGDFWYLLQHLLACTLSAVEKGRDIKPSEKHFHDHTQGHAGKSFIGEQSPIVHERSQEILPPQTQAHCYADDQCRAYYQAAGGEKKRRVYSLESQAKSYHGPNLHISLGSDATSPATLLNIQSLPIGNVLLNVQSTPTGNEEELVMQLIPIFVDDVRRAISSPPNTHTDHPLLAAPTTANMDKVHTWVSDDDGNSTASSH